MHWYYLETIIPRTFSQYWVSIWFDFNHGHFPLFTLWPNLNINLCIVIAWQKKVIVVEIGWIHFTNASPLDFKISTLSTLLVTYPPSGRECWSFLRWSPLIDWSLNRFQGWFNITLLQILLFRLHFARSFPCAGWASVIINWCHRCVKQM